jgi:hypothetical protein
MTANITANTTNTIRKAGFPVKEKPAFVHVAQV